MDCAECGQMLSSDREILGHDVCAYCELEKRREHIEYLAELIDEQMAKGLSLGEAASEIQIQTKCDDKAIDDAMWLVNYGRD